jgi:4-hydroxy-tetrahydrodipicolinate reductase
VAGATGWTGSAITRAVLADDELSLTGAVSRQTAGRNAAQEVGSDVPNPVVISATVEEALAAGADVLIDYTHPAVVKGHVLQALEQGAGAVVGTSGLSAVDYDQIDERARQQELGVIAAGNFSLTAALLKHFATIAARHVPHWEIIDMSGATKPDAPSGTALELAEALGQAAANQVAVPVGDILGRQDTRGATIGGAQVHSIRLPSYVLSVEAQFGLPSERLSIRHDAGTDATPYVGGTVLAARNVPETVGLVRGLDTLLFS